MGERTKLDRVDAPPDGAASFEQDNYSGPFVVGDTSQRAKEFTCSGCRTLLILGVPDADPVDVYLGCSAGHWSRASVGRRVYDAMVAHAVPNGTPNHYRFAEPLPLPPGFA